MSPTARHCARSRSHSVIASPAALRSQQAPGEATFGRCTMNAFEHAPAKGCFALRARNDGKMIGAGALLVLMMAGCAHTPPRQPTGLKAADFWSKQRERRAAISRLQAKVHVRYQGPRESVSGKGRLLFDFPDRLRLEIRDPLGRLQYLAAVDREAFTAYYPSQARAYRDAQAGRAYVRRFLGIPLSFRDLQSVFLGVIGDATGVGSFTEWEWVPDRGQYRGVGSVGATRVICHVDPDTALPVEVEWETGGERLSVHYADFENCCAGPPILLAHEVEIAVESGGTRVATEWGAVERVKDKIQGQAFKVLIPDGVAVVALP